MKGGNNEETIKRLKVNCRSLTATSKLIVVICLQQSLVVACGMRKVWSKVFQDIDQPSQQIKKLKEILTELGMTGRMSLEQAKKIKEKRELAKELGRSYLGLLPWASILMVSDILFKRTCSPLNSLWLAGLHAVERRRSQSNQRVNTRQRKSRRKPKMTSCYR